MLEEGMSVIVEEVLGEGDLEEMREGEAQGVREAAAVELVEGQPLWECVTEGEKLPERE